MNNNKNAIAIFEADMRSVTSLAISMVTGEPWSHAAIRIDGVWYDSSETRGYFDKVNVDSYDNRWCIIVEFDGELDDWLDSMKGKKYNWKGIYKYPFSKFTKRNSNEFYCFQAAFDAAWYSIYKEHFSPPKVSGGTLKEFILKMDESRFIYKKGLNNKLVESI